jgi:ATP-GRASP peptide maturase of grasp-with-spasm system
MVLKPKSNTAENDRPLLVLIVSEDGDGSCEDTIDWIHHFGCEFLRIGATEAYILERFLILADGGVEFEFSGEGRNICSHDIGAYWYRRGDLQLDPILHLEAASLPDGLKQHLGNELLACKLAVLKALESRNSIGSYFKTLMNKVHVLQTAAACGLEIPPTQISSNRKVNVDFVHQQDCIAKDVQDAWPFAHAGHTFFKFTATVNSEQLDCLSEYHFPGLLQAEVKKRYELRILYLKGKLYSAAIFSQSSDQAAVDWRNHGAHGPRMVPYTLPGAVEEGIRRMMMKLELDCGVIDMAVDAQGRHVFFEVNPTGQYEMISSSCNFYLEKAIASTLTAFIQGGS